jgi:Fe-Mn family superoxide dismutase
LENIELLKTISDMSFIQPKLKYDYTALEPYIDARTMEIHYTKHHAGYTNNLNKAIEGTELDGKTIEEVLSVVSKFPAAVRNNAGGFYNHNLYWDVMQPGGSSGPKGELEAAISSTFGSLGAFKDLFSKAAATRFGSGWAWLIKDGNALKVESTPNQDNPLMDVSDVKGTPILGIDVWEHAYYLNYQNRRPEYIEAFWKVINWDEVDRRFKG